MCYFRGILNTPHLSIIAMDHQQYFDLNRQHWDAATPKHIASPFYDYEGFVAHPDVLHPIEVEGVGDITGKSLLHLQCHFGQDTLSWVTRGASHVTGVDLSPEAVAAARKLAERVGYAAQSDFVTSNVLDIGDKLGGRQYDVVFTSYGCVTWLPELQSWAAEIVRHLKSGGAFYIADFHPFFWMFDDRVPELTYRYFHHPEPVCETQTATYAADELPETTTECFWAYALSEIMQPLLAQGLQLESFEEYDYTPHAVYPERLVQRAEREYVFSPHGREVPLTFAMRFRKR